MMSVAWYIRFISLGLVLNADTCTCAVPSCTFKWFDSPCRYRCNCMYDSCYANGECIGSSGCKDGWFGPACQYVNLVTTNATSSTPTWVYDFPDTQCNQGQETLTVFLNDAFYFTWLRLRVNSSVTSKDIKLQLSTYYYNVQCSNMYVLKISDTVLDIHCQPGVLFQNLTITGIGVRSLCQVYISGGRNVALGQETTQSSTAYDGNSTYAVDGYKHPDYVYYYTLVCARTNEEQNPYWKLNFAKPKQVHRFVINNINLYQDRLLGFVLEAYQQNNNLVFTNTDSSYTRQDIYRIHSTTPETPVSSVRIVGNNPSDHYLSLCEVEMFGDAVCDYGLHGRECENQCNCAKDEQCFVSTGGCPSGCAAGYQGQGCQIPCPPTKFGQDCTETCSTNCSSQLCHSVTGKCVSCIQKLAGDFCNHTLPASEPDESPPVAAIVGPVVALVVLVSLIVGGVCICRRHKNTQNKQEQTSPRRFQNVAEKECVETGNNGEVTTKSLKVVTGQEKPSVMRKSIDCQDNTEINPHIVDHAYFNFVPRLSEESDILNDQGNSTAENRKKYPQEFNNVRTSNSTAREAAGSSDHQNNDRHTNGSDYSSYEIPTASSAVTQKSHQPESEDGLVYANDITTNIYDSIDDNIPNPYEEINDT